MRRGPAQLELPNREGQAIPSMLPMPPNVAVAGCRIGQALSLIGAKYITRCFRRTPGRLPDRSVSPYMD
jgi:hypothetical protein